MRGTLQTPLVGAVGQSYVQRILSHNDPLKAIQLVQSRAGLTATNTKPLLGLLDQVGITRYPPLLTITVWGQA